MSKYFQIITLLGAISTPVHAALLFADNFNAPDTTNFDGASLAGRESGSEAGAADFRSWGAQQHINNNQLLIPGGGGVRFNGQTTRYDWASGGSGASILADGGFIVTFDWIPQDDINNEWVSYQVGTINNDSGNLTHPGTDYGILFRNAGGTERFDNNANLGAGLSFTTTPGGIPRRIEITYTFTSFADGTTVNAVSKVNGFQVASDNFTWDGNAGQIHMEIGNGVPNTRVDNFSITTIPEPASAVLLAGVLGLVSRRRRA